MWFFPSGNIAIGNLLALKINSAQLNFRKNLSCKTLPASVQTYTRVNIFNMAVGTGVD